MKLVDGLNVLFSNVEASLLARNVPLTNWDVRAQMCLGNYIYLVTSFNVGCSYHITQYAQTHLNACESPSVVSLARQTDGQSDSDAPPTVLPAG